MADITMCVGTGCPRKDSCYRYTAPINPFRQSFFVVVPLQFNGKCEEYWSNTGLFASSEALRRKELPDGTDIASNAPIPQPTRARSGKEH